jgi:hypothetical protein
MSKPQITTHYADGRPSETRNMTDEEISQLPTELLFHEEATDETPSAIDSEQ